MVYIHHPYPSFSTEHSQRIYTAPINNNPAPAASVVPDNPTLVSFVTERVDTAASPHAPAFLRNLPKANEDPQGYRAVTLNYAATVQFKITCVPDINWLMAILQSPAHPQLYMAVTKLEFSGFHWFSGIAHNRHVNPNLELVASLPSVAEVAIYLHTAGLTVSVWNERERLRLENQGFLERSKQLRVLSLRDVVQKYDLEKMLACGALRVVTLVIYDCSTVRYHCGQADPLAGFCQLQNWLMMGFLQDQGRRVDVQLVRERLDANGTKVRENLN